MTGRLVLGALLIIAGGQLAMASAVPSDGWVIVPTVVISPSPIRVTKTPSNGWPSLPLNDCTGMASRSVPGHQSRAWWSLSAVE